LYAKDFDNSGKLDLVFGYYNNDTLYPLHGLKSSYSQLAFIKQKFETFDAFARATLENIYGTENLKSALAFKTVNFASSYLQNNGEGIFSIVSLPMAAQISSVNGILSGDFDGDGHTDIVIAGNMFGSEPETPRNDASIGLFLRGDGTGNFIPVPAMESGLNIGGDVRKISLIRLEKSKARGIIATKNNSFMQVVKIINGDQKP